MIVATADDLLEAGVRLLERGLPVIPCDGKQPIGRGWQDESITVDRLEAGLANADAPTLGMLLGKSSGIIDVETDSPDEVAAMQHLFRDCERPITVTYTSPRGKHFWFKVDPRLAALGRATIKYAIPAGQSVTIRIGGRGAQSIIPPSAGREWLPGLSIEECDPAPLPELVIERLLASAGIGCRPRIVCNLSGSAEGSRNNDMASFVGKVAREYGDLESGQQVILQVALGQNRLNTPPLPDSEVRQVVTSIVAKELARRAGESLEAIIRTPEHHATADGLPFRLVVIEAEPRRYELHSERFAAGHVTLTGDQLASWPKMRVALLEQASCVVPSGQKYTKLWTQQGGILEQLMATAEHRQPPREELRRVVVAQRLMEFLDKAKPYRDDVPMRVDAGCCKLEDGSAVFRFNTLLESLTAYGNVDKLNRFELSAMLTEHGMSEYRPWVADGKARPKYKRLPAKGLESLAEAAYGPAPKSPI